MTKGELYLTDSCLIGPMMLLMNQYFNYLLPEYYVLWLCFVSICSDDVYLPVLAKNLELCLYYQQVVQSLRFGCIQLQSVSTDLYTFADIFVSNWQKAATPDSIGIGAGH